MSKNKLIITDAALIPDDLQFISVRFRLDEWRAAQVILQLEVAYEAGDPIPSNERIRAALAKPCLRCDGTGKHGCSIPEHACPECNGTKTASVPGVRLEPRGESVVVK